MRHRKGILTQWESEIGLARVANLWSCTSGTLIVALLLSWFTWMHWGYPGNTAVASGIGQDKGKPITLESFMRHTLDGKEHWNLLTKIPLGDLKKGVTISWNGKSKKGKWQLKIFWVVPDVNAFQLLNADNPLGQFRTSRSQGQVLKAAFPLKGNAAWRVSRKPASVVKEAKWPNITESVTVKPGTILLVVPIQKCICARGETGTELFYVTDEIILATFKKGQKKLKVIEPGQPKCGAPQTWPSIH